MLCYFHYLISKDNGKKSSIIFDEIYQRIVSSRLIDKLKEIRIVTVGDYKKLSFNELKYPKCRIIHHVEDVYQYEFPTLIKIKEHGHQLDDDCKILYLHLKGVVSNQTQWRNDMLHVVIDKHQKCISSLNEYDSCGARICEPYVINEKIPRHFSGNFWWTTAKHIKNLPNPGCESFFKDFDFLISGKKDKKNNGYILKPRRYLAEFWIGLLDIDLEKKHKLKEII